MIGVSVSLLGISTSPLSRTVSGNVANEKIATKIKTIDKKRFIKRTLLNFGTKQGDEILTLLSQSTYESLTYIRSFRAV